jgi:hypothetical protein
MGFTKDHESHRFRRDQSILDSGTRYGTLAAPTAPTEIITAAEAPVSPIRHLTQIEVARRWRMSDRTLETWRWKKIGPPHLRIGSKVIYRLEDVIAYEAAHLRQGAR